MQRYPATHMAQTGRLGWCTNKRLEKEKTNGVGEGCVVGALAPRVNDMPTDKFVQAKRFFSLLLYILSRTFGKVFIQNGPGANAGLALRIMVNHSPDRAKLVLFPTMFFLFPGDANSYQSPRTIAV